MFIGELTRPNIIGKDPVEDPKYRTGVDYSNDAIMMTMYKMKKEEKTITIDTLFSELKNWYDKTKPQKYSYLECNYEWCYVCNSDKKNVFDKCMLMSRTEYMKPEYQQLRRYDGPIGCYERGSGCYYGSHFKCEKKYLRCVLTNDPVDTSGNKVDKVFDSYDSCAKECKMPTAFELSYSSGIIGEKTTKYMRYQIVGIGCVPTTRMGPNTFQRLEECQKAFYIRGPF